MVVMSFMMENLAPVARGVNEIVHQMHGSDVTLQILSHSILYAAITIMQVMQQHCITHSVGLAVSGGGDGADALPFRPDVAAWSTFSPLGGGMRAIAQVLAMACFLALGTAGRAWARARKQAIARRSEEHTSELQSHSDLVCRLLLEKKKKNARTIITLR